MAATLFLHSNILVPMMLLWYMLKLLTSSSETICSSWQSTKGEHIQTISRYVDNFCDWCNMLSVSCLDTDGRVHDLSSHVLGKDEHKKQDDGPITGHKMNQVGPRLQ